MKYLLRLPLYCLIALFMMLLILIFFSVSNEPEVKLDWAMTQADVNRAKKILHEGYKVRQDEIGTIELSYADLNLATNYLLNRFTKGKAVISLKPNKLKFNVTATLPENRLGKYVNITFRLGNEDNNPLPTLTKFKAGKLLLPPKLAAYVIEAVIKHSKLNEYFILATRPIQAVAIGADRIKITYHPSKATVDTARDLLAYNKTEYDQAKVYKAKLTEIIQKHDPNWRLSLAELLQPLFAIAYERSTLTTAIEANRTVINTVNDYVNNSKTVGNPVKPYYPAFMYKQNDLAQHFIGAAAITTSVNSQIAEVIGEEKELRDAQKGSGFSFKDLAADKAGTRFGELATANAKSARKLQQVMAVIKDYTAFMPDPKNLPEPMDETTFKQRYGSTKSHTYQEVSKQIDALISEIPLYQE